MSRKKLISDLQWQRGYGALSVSQSQIALVMRYIENQTEHHRRQSFRDEYLAILRRHQIEFDPRYDFDDEITT
jgi:putative transposase